MALLTVAGFGVVRGVLAFPRIGAWHADLELDTLDAPVGAVTIDVSAGELVLSGTVSQGGEYQGLARLRIVGGADGLRKAARPRHYVRPQLRLPLADLIAGAGEKLSPTVDGSLLGAHLNAWSTLAQPTGLQIAALVERATPAGTSWRLLEDGTVWLGPEAWPDSGITEWREIDQAVRDRRLEIALDAPTLVAGTMLGDFKVDYVEHIIDGETARSRIWIAE